MFQSVLDPRVAQVGLRAVQNAYTSTLTVTAGSIAVGSPVIIETSSNSLPTTTTDSSRTHQWARRPATSTSLANNLFQGLVKQVPGTKAYLDREEVGLVQCYGIYPGAIVQRPTSEIGLAGAVLIPESLQYLLSVTGPVTAASTGTAANVEVPALGGLAILIQSIASSSATETTTAAVFLRCM